MRNIAAAILLTTLSACGGVGAPDEAAMPDNAKVTFVGVDETGKVVSQVVDGATYNRLAQSKREKMLAFQRGGASAVKALEAVKQAATTYVGNAGPGCTSFGCPEHPYAICVDSDTWVYNVHYGYTTWDYPLIIGCFRGTSWSPLTGGLTFYDPTKGSSSWAYSTMSSWAGSQAVGFSASSDFYQAPTVDPAIRQTAAWAQHDWGTTWDNPPPLGQQARYLARLYQWP